MQLSCARVILSVTFKSSSRPQATLELLYSGEEESAEFVRSPAQAAITGEKGLTGRW